MHPVLARYMNLDLAVDTLHRDELGQVLKAEERPFAAAARAHPEERAAVLSARGQSHPAPQAQQALIVLAAHAAAAALREDERLGPKLMRARETLAAHGGSEDEVDQFAASVVLEEGFGYDDPADGFDPGFIGETLDGVGVLIELTPERTASLREAFAKTAPPDWHGAYQVVSACLMEAAWSEGPQPINPEHVQEALACAEEKLGEPEVARAVEASRRFIRFLERAGLCGPLRRARLERVVDAAALELGPGAGGRAS